MDRRPLVVDLYARLSRCPDDGSLEKVDTQLEDCRAVAARNGWTIGREHRDNSLSAWKRGVRRPGWEMLLSRVESGEVDGVLVWHTDRLLRQPRDLERLIDLGDKRGLVLASAYGEHDISNADHRLAMRINAAVACKASDDASRRLMRKFETMREAGMTNGGARAFGFAGRDRRTREPVPAALVERERAALRAAAEGIASGAVSLAGVAQEWNAEGLRSATGATWTSITVREVLQRPRNAGLVEHDGVVVGRMEGEPILGRDLHDELRSVFAARRRGRIAGETYLGSGIVLCGECGKSLSGRPHSGVYPDGAPRRQYHCHKGRGGCGAVAADVRRVDEALRSWTLRCLGNPQHVARLAAAAADTAQRATQLAEKIIRAQTLTQQLSERVGLGEIDIDEYDAAMRPLRERIARLKAERDALSTPAAGELPGADADTGELARQWAEGDVAERRSLLLTALRGMRVTLLPAHGSRTWNARRIEIEPIHPTTTE